MSELKSAISNLGWKWSQPNMHAIQNLSYCYIWLHCAARAYMPSAFLSFLPETGWRLTRNFITKTTIHILIKQWQKHTATMYQKLAFTTFDVYQTLHPVWNISKNIYVFILLIFETRRSTLDVRHYRWKVVSGQHQILKCEVKWTYRSPESKPLHYCDEIHWDTTTLQFEQHAT